jgi:hypothetical protein
MLSDGTGYRMMGSAWSAGRQRYWRPIRLFAADGRCEEGTLAPLRRELVDPAIAERRGPHLSSTSPATFASVVNAMRCAVETQRVMGERSAGVLPSSRVEFRIGIHVHRRAAERNPVELVEQREALALCRMPSEVRCWGHPVAYLNSGSVLSPSLVPPGSRTFLSANFRVS